MDPFVVDPASYDKHAALLAARAYVEAFLDLNGIPHPTRYLWEPDDSQKPPGDNGWHQKGWYWAGTVFVNAKRSRKPVKVPGFQWSYTGFKADLTAPGVLAHEVGHHVHLGWVRRDAFEMGRLGIELERLQRDEAPVSGYEPNRHELFAEAMRLFILNPELLREGRPQRWEMLARELGLKPLHAAPWREVLRNAHPRIINAAESWIR